MRRADGYFEAVLSASEMQEVPQDEQAPTGRLAPSCVSQVPEGEHRATPPRRLVEVARGFGAEGVLGSICTDDFGVTTGRIIRALAQQLSAGHSR